MDIYQETETSEINLHLHERTGIDLKTYPAV